MSDFCTLEEFADEQDDARVAGLLRSLQAQFEELSRGSDAPLVIKADRRQFRALKAILNWPAARRARLEQTLDELIDAFAAQ
jgi:hypothetical protein